ncbi:DNA alkylation repair protein [Rickettsia hoogstraalii]|uniref:DNA alkylation repair protein n=1 Tax=Rickettsia hoogstraalii TaxID=467174 RepID=UPI002255148C|nr:DNA alkylation repair protein [Rickettsia hoogstraalii]MCX4083782.1 DNA alkylation repair protein [Rickettsia hoogstraalii]
MKENLQQIRNILLENATIPVERRTLFFKTKEGEYGEHDRFIGVTVPILRKIAKSYYNLDVGDLSRLITSEFNEERFLALAILIMQYQKAQDKEFFYNFYLNNIKYVNNWNLVDASAHHVVGAYLWDKEKDYLFTLTKSEILWERRIAIVATWYFIKNNQLDTTFEIAKLLLNDKHDLMHKAIGWMLREAGKKDEKQLIDFLDRYISQMPRTSVRYAIEKFPEEVRKNILQKK